jgi:hypothetical protein
MNMGSLERLKVAGRSMLILSTVSHLAFHLRKYTLTGVIAVDQPVGTGFSYGSTDRYIKELKDVRFCPCMPG